MNCEALELLDKEALIHLVLKQAETIAALTRHVERLTARVAELEAKLGLPPKTPDNSSTPPSQGRKPSADQATSGKGQRKSHPGTTVPCIPIRRASATSWPIIAGIAGLTCRASRRPRSRLRPHRASRDQADVTRVTLHRGFCPCCGRPFRAEAPAGLEPGSPFGPNLRAFAIYLRFVHAISFERLDVRQNWSRLSEQFFRIASGAQVPLSAVARIKRSTAPLAVNHQDDSRGHDHL